MGIFNTHDQILFEKISAVFNSDLQIYLHDFDFADTGRMTMIEAIFELNHYSDTSDYEFLEVDELFLQTYYNLKNTIQKFLLVFSRNTTPTGEKMFQVAPAHEWEIGDTERYRKEANDINETAMNLHNQIRKFIQEGKKRSTMSNDNPTNQTINFNGNVGNASVGDNNTLINDSASEYNQKLEILIGQISDSSIQDKEAIVNQINRAKELEDKNTIMNILGGLLSRGVEASSLARNIAGVLAL